VHFPGNLTSGPTLLGAQRMSVHYSGKKNRFTIWGKGIFVDALFGRETRTQWGRAAAKGPQMPRATGSRPNSGRISHLSTCGSRKSTILGLATVGTVASERLGDLQRTQVEKIKKIPEFGRDHVARARQLGASPPRAQGLLGAAP